MTHQLIKDLRKSKHFTVGEIIRSYDNSRFDYEVIAVHSLREITVRTHSELATGDKYGEGCRASFGKTRNFYTEENREITQ